MSTPATSPWALRLPRLSPQPVMALGAFMKNTACFLNGDLAIFSALHGDLTDPSACEALVASAHALAEVAGVRPVAIAHDLHPDFYSTVYAERLAAEWHVPAVAVQHHRAHIAAVQAEQGFVDALIGIALDGVGLGVDGQSWGGEVLWLDRAEALSRSSYANRLSFGLENEGDAIGRAPFGWQRCNHLAPLCMPGGDRAAREPWRLAAAVLHALGRGDEIIPRFEATVSREASAWLRQQLERSINVPSTTAAGRWFDAAAAALGLHLGSQEEAEAARSLQVNAESWVREHGWPALDEPRPSGLDLTPVLANLLDWPAQHSRQHGAAVFHVELVMALADSAMAVARRHGVDTIAFGGGCFHNGLLEQGLRMRLESAGFRCIRPQQVSCGDAGIALGQAWVASWLAAMHT